MLNQRIKELAVEARLISAEPNGFDPTNLNVAQRKFAELIVRECASVTLDYKNDDHYAGWLEYRDEIKQHFGVE